jgi:hypothetical protein
MVGSATGLVSVCGAGDGRASVRRARSARRQPTRFDHSWRSGLVVDSAAPCWARCSRTGTIVGPRRTLADAVTIAVPDEQVFRGLP